MSDVTTVRTLVDGVVVVSRLNRAEEVIGMPVAVTLSLTYTYSMIVPHGSVPVMIELVH